MGKTFSELTFEAETGVSDPKEKLEKLLKDKGLEDADIIDVLSLLDELIGTEKTKALLNEEEPIRVEIIGVKDNLIFTKINGQEYGYKSISMDPEELLKKYVEIEKYSPGRALAYLKKNANHVTGGVKPMIESTLTPEAFLQYMYDDEIVLLMSNNTKFYVEKTHPSVDMEAALTYKFKLISENYDLDNYKCFDNFNIDCVTNSGTEKYYIKLNTDNSLVVQKR